MRQIRLYCLSIIAAFAVQSNAVAYYSPCPGSTVPAVIRAVGIPQPNGNIFPGNATSPPSGLLVDLLDALQQQTGIPYLLTLKPELVLYDGFEFSGTVLQSLINNEADLGLSLSAITVAGNTAVDYLQSFQNNIVNIQLLYNAKFGLNSATQYLAVQQFGDLNYLKGSKNATLRAIYNNILAGAPDSFPAGDNEAIAKVLTGNFAYVCDSPFRDQLVAEHPNELSASADVLGIKHLALAVQKGSPLRGILNIALQQLEQDGTLALLAAKYPSF